MTEMTIDEAFYQAVAHHNGGRFAEAEELYRKILAVHPKHAEAHNNMGILLADKGMLDEAIGCFRQAIEISPRFAAAIGNLANLLEARGQSEEAVRCGQEALKLDPENPVLWCNLGSALHSLKRLGEAAAAFEQAIARRPDYVAAHNNLGSVWRDRGMPDKAIASYREALRLNPKAVESWNNLACSLCESGQLEEGMGCFRRALEMDPGFSRLHSNLVYMMLFHPAYDALAIRKALGEWNLRHAAPLRKFVVPHRNDRSPDRRLRVGYVSPDFRDHVVGRFLRPLLAAGDHHDFEVFCYSDVIAPDVRTEQLRGYADHWRLIVGMSDERVAELIRADQIDVLVDLTMHMMGNRLLVFARKPAPVQVTYLAYCSSTGLETMDYRLSDPYLDPPGVDLNLYSEETVRLPETYWCYEASAGTPEVNEPPVLKAGHVTFGCLNDFRKVSEPALVAWGSLLQNVADSRLIMYAPEGSHRERVCQRFEAKGVERTRVEFVGFVAEEEYFREYQRMDIALDPFPYAGGTTTCDALWMGVPVVTLAGKLAVGGGGVSILSNVGVKELIARDAEEYIRIAAELAGDIERLKELRKTLRGKMKNSPLMNAEKFAGDMEKAYRWMWKRWCEGKER